MSARRPAPAAASPLRATIVLLALASGVTGAAAQDGSAIGLNAEADAWEVAVGTVLNVLQENGTLPQELRLVVSPRRLTIPRGGVLLRTGPSMDPFLVRTLAERLDGRVAPLGDVRVCPSDTPRGCSLRDADAVVSVGELDGEGDRVEVLVSVHHHVPSDAPRQPIHQVVYRLELLRSADGWVAGAPDVYSIT